MSFIEGGLLERFIEESVYRLIVDALDDLGWFDTGRQHEPIVPRAEPYALDETIEKNALVIELELTEDEEFETGQAAAIEDGIDAYVDFYAENTSLGRHLAGDVRGILRGKMPSIGRLTNTFEIIDWSLATPTPIAGAYGIFEDITTARASVFSRPWKNTLFSTKFRVIVSTDTYERA